MSPFRIVVADDHELMRKAVRTLLEGDAGQQVIGEAASGLETIAQVASLNPDLLILDLAMPELDGLEVAARLQQTHPRTKMILLTANATPALEIHAQAVGIYRCVSKSGAPRDLTDAVRGVRRDYGNAPGLAAASVSESVSVASGEVKTRQVPPSLDLPLPMTATADTAVCQGRVEESEEKLN